MFSTQYISRSYGYMCPKMFFSQNLVLVLEMTVLERHMEHFFCENIVKELNWLRNFVLCFSQTPAPSSPTHTLRLTLLSPYIYV